MEAELRAGVGALRALWPGGAVSTVEPTTALDHFYSDGRSVGCAFKLTFSAADGRFIDTVYMYSNGEFWSLTNSLAVSATVQAWVASLRTSTAVAPDTLKGVAESNQ